MIAIVIIAPQRRPPAASRASSGPPRAPRRAGGPAPWSHRVGRTSIYLSIYLSIYVYIYIYIYISALGESRLRLGPARACLVPHRWKRGARNPGAPASLPAAHLCFSLLAMLISESATSSYANGYLHSSVHGSLLAPEYISMLLIVSMFLGCKRQSYYLPLWI